MPLPLITNIKVDEDQKLKNKDQKLKEAFKKHDVNRDGVLSKRNGTAKVTFTEEQLKGLFRRFDIDGDGRLSKQELNQAFTSLGSSFPAWRTWRALCHADENGDGYITEEEFDHLVKYVVKRNYAIN